MADGHYLCVEFFQTLVNDTLMKVTGGFTIFV